MTFTAAVRTCLRKYMVFSGRAARSEFWWFVLFSFLTSFVVGFIEGFLRAALRLGQPDTFLSLTTVVGLALVLPGFAVASRRLHDIGWSGWWVLFPVALGSVGGGVAGAIAGYLTTSGVLGGRLEDNAALAGGAVGLLAALFVLFLYTRPSQPGTNKYGPNPTEATP